MATIASQAILSACRVRLRPVLMTSIAFIMGVVPLVFSSGAGAEIRSAMGVAVFSGMVGVTVFGLFLTPVFYTVIGRLAGAQADAHVGGRDPAHSLKREVTDDAHVLSLSFCCCLSRGSVRDAPSVLRAAGRARRRWSTLIPRC